MLDNETCISANHHITSGGEIWPERHCCWLFRTTATSNKRSLTFSLICFDVWTAHPSHMVTGSMQVCQPVHTSSLPSTETHLPHTLGITVYIVYIQDIVHEYLGFFAVHRKAFGRWLSCLVFRNSNQLFLILPRRPTGQDSITVVAPLFSFSFFRRQLSKQQM